VSEQQGTSSVDAALEVVRMCQTVSTAYGRPDLAARLGTKAELLLDPLFHVLVVGEFKQGKSSLVNALVSNQICPVDEDIATAVPTVLRWAQEPVATAVFREEGDDVHMRRESISLDDVASYATEQVDGPQPQIHSVEIGLPSRLLSGGLVLVDTPGVGGLGSTHGAVTAAALPMAEAVIFVSDASQEFTAPELEFMRATRKLCPNLVCLITKTDFYPGWRKIRDLNAAHLQRLGVSAPIIPASASLQAAAMATGDGKLLDESGYLELTNFIREEVLGSAVELSVAAAARDLQDVVDQLADQFLSQKTVLEDPEALQKMISQLEATKDRAEELKSRAARWQVTLGDGVQDLNADVDHDLRERFRLINFEAEDAIERADPAAIWGEFEPWLYHRAAVDVVQNFEFLQSRARDLAAQVAEHFEIDAVGLHLDFGTQDPDSALSQIKSQATLDVEKVSAAASLIVGARGGMGGMMMFGMLSSMVGLALGPVGLGAGLLMGRKQIKDDQQRQVVARRAQARAVQRKYMDDVTFRTTKDARDNLKLVQRQIREHFTSRAEEQGKATQETLAAVQASAKLNEIERTQQLANVNAELKRLAGLRERIDALSPRLAGFGNSGASQ
jgi:hypothetical protein